MLLKSNCDTRELHYNKEQLKLLLKAAVAQQSYIKKITNSGENYILTTTVTQGGYITINRAMAVATLSDSDTTELYITTKEQWWLLL